MNPPTLLLVEDDPDLGVELSDFLESEGFQVRRARSLREAEVELQHVFDLLVLDLNLPDGSGVDLCMRLRRYVRSGIVICSGRSERELRLSLLRNGADAFLVKPVDPAELAAVLFSVLRRVAPAPAMPLMPSAVPVVWRLDRVQQALLGPARTEVPLSSAECLMLSTLLSSPERVASRDVLLQSFDRAGTPMTGPRLESLVSRLRGKVFSACGQRLPLRASYGRGYAFTAHGEVI